MRARSDPRRWALSPPGLASASTARWAAAFARTALPAVLDWLAVRGDQPGPLLNPILKGGRLQERAMSPQAIRDLCCKLTLAASTAAATPRDWLATWSGATRPEVARHR